MDLARRGFLSVREIAEERRVLGLSLGQRRDYVLVLERRDDFQHPYEAAVFDLLASAATGTPPRARLSDLTSEFRSGMGEITRGIEEELLAQGLFSPQGRRRRGRFRIVGFVLIGLSVLLIGVTVVFIPRLGPGALGLFGAVAALRFVAFALSALTSQRTEQGAYPAGLWSAFRAYLF